MPTAKTNPYITPGLFKFLADLKKNNHRDWFNDNKQRFEDNVREPLLDFINDFTPHLKEISPHFLAEPKKNGGGSLFRIYRDVRFSANKQPYKTNAALHFRHDSAKDVHAPGFYMHFEPGAVFAGVGVYRPQPAIAQKIRLHIGEHREEWLAATRDKKVSKIWELNRELTLQRPPKGFDKEDQLIDDLKLKSFTMFSQMTEEDAIKPNFMKEYAKRCKIAAPYASFLTSALGVPF